MLPGALRSPIAMVDTVAASFGKPFTAQVAAFRLRLGDLVPTSRWDDLRREQHDRAFMVAGAVQADLLADLGAAVDRAITEGTGYDQFRPEFREIVARRGWHGWTGEGSAAGEEWRMRTIYRTNMRTTYMAGRYAQLVDGNYRYWVYHHSGAAHPRLDHLSWDKIALPPDHPFWRTHYPPNGWGCGCTVEGVRGARRLERIGGDPEKPLPEGWDRPDPRTGTLPGIDRNWDYAPGASVQEDIVYAARKAVSWEYHSAKAFMASLPQANRDALSVAYRQLPGLADNLAAWAGAARAGRDAAEMRTLGLLTADHRRRLGDFGVDLRAVPFDWSIDTDAAKHVFKQHGDEAAEALRGQRAVTPADIARIARMLDDPDAVTDLGNDPAHGRLIEVTKVFDGERQKAVFAVKTGRQRLKLVTTFVGRIGRSRP